MGASSVGRNESLGVGGFSARFEGFFWAMKAGVVTCGVKMEKIREIMGNISESKFSLYVVNI